MSSSVDDRIVAMKFDNKQFEAGTATTINTLDRLKKGLDLSSSAKGLEGLGASARSVSFDTLANGVEAVKVKFSALQVIAITALANITNSAINAGKNLISSLTIGPIAKGFKEYEQGLSAYQTILANTQGQTAKVSQQTINSINTTAAAASKAAITNDAQAIKGLAKTQADVSEVLDKAIKKETESLKTAHDEKLKFYNDEYMAKLKIMDEDKYNQLKTLDNQISSINGITKAEDAASKKVAQDAQLQLLKDKVANATTDKNRINAAQALTDFETQLSREQVLAGRQMQIGVLENNKISIQAAYDLAATQLKTEYDLKATKENDLYQISSDNLKESHDAKLKALKEIQSAQSDYAQGQQERDLSYIEASKSAQIQALNDIAKATKIITTEADINKALIELNKYANKTVYSFGEMNNAVGIFTAQGVNLKDSVSGVEGIYNLVSMVGADASKAAGAVYQLSQAIASGTVRAEDWRSVETAGFGGQGFQDQLQQTARVHGVAVDKMISKNGSFRLSLQEGWLSSEILLETLSQYAAQYSDEQLKSLGYSDEQVKQIQELGKTASESATVIKSYTQLIDILSSNAVTGWATTFKTVIGDLGEAKVLWTAIGNSIGGTMQASADARNKMLADWAALGGRQVLIDGLVNAFKGLTAILAPIGQAFKEVFPATTGKTLYDLTVAFRIFTAGFTLSASTSENLKNTFKGLFSVLDIGRKGVTLLGSAIGSLIGFLLPGTGSILSLTSAIGKFLSSLDASINLSTIMNGTLANMGGAFGFIKDQLTKLDPVFTIMKDLCKQLGDSLIYVLGGSKVMAAGLSDAEPAMSGSATVVERIKEAFVGLWDILSKIGGFIAKVAMTVVKTLTPAFDFIKKKLDELNMQDLGALLSGGGLILFALSILKLAKTITRGLGNIADVIKSFKKVIDEVGDTLKAFQLKIKAEALLKIAISLAILAAALVALSFINIVDLGKALGALSVMLIELVIALAILDNGSKTMNILQKKGQKQLIGLGICLLLLASAVKILAEIPIEKLGQGVSALGGLLLLVALFVKSTDGSDLKGSAGGLTAFAIGIVILSGALVILGKIKPNTLMQGITAIGGLMLLIAMFVMATKEGDLKASAGGLTAFALGLMILVGALAILGAMDQGKLLQGATAIGALMLVIAMFIMSVSGEDLKKTAGGLLAFSLGLLVLVGALAILSNMNTLKLLQGGVAIFFILEAISLFIKSVKKGALAASAAGMIGFAFGLTILVAAVALLGNMDTIKVIQGVAALSVLMWAIGEFVATTNGGSLGIAAAGLIGFSFGLTLLCASVAILASIDPKRIFQGVLAFTALLLTIGFFVKMTNGGSLAIAAAGIIAFAGGIAILAGVIAILSALNPGKIIMATGAIVALILAIGLFVNLTSGADLAITAIGLVAFVGAIVLLTLAMQALGEIPLNTLLIGIGALAAMLIIIGVASVVLSGLAPEILIMSGLLVLFGIGCMSVALAMLVFANGLTILAATGTAGVATLTTVILAIVALIPQILVTLALGLIQFAVTIGNGAVTIGAAFLKVLVAIINTIITVTPQILGCIGNFIIQFLNFILTYLPSIINMGVQIVLSLMSGITANIGRLIDAGIKLIIAFINGMADGIRNNSGAINNACANLMDAVVNGVGSFWWKMLSTGGNIVAGMIQGIKNKASELGVAAIGVAKNMVNGVLHFLGIQSPSKVFASIGEYSGMGLIVGLKSYSGKVADAATNVGKSAVNAMSDSIAGISDLITNGIDANPTIRPVLDLSNIQNGQKQLYSMMDDVNGYAVSGSLNVATNATSNLNNKQTIVDPAVSSLDGLKDTIKEFIANALPAVPNVFHITGDNPKDIADEVGAVLQKQVERRDAVWDL